MARAQGQIAVFDSGLGGISVLRELVRQMPHEQFLYFGDSANAPYGSRSTAEVRALTLGSIDALMARGVKAVVVACNTATSAAIDELRLRYPDTIIVGIEPALKLAADHCPRGRILVMATEVTLREKKFMRLMATYGASREIIPLPCPELVRFVEKGLLDGPEVETTLRLLALIRLLHPRVLLPATTALGTLHPQGRELGIRFGANVVMPNLSPKMHRKDYAIYDNKICTGEEAAECRACTEHRIRKTGYETVVDRGDFKE